MPQARKRLVSTEMTPFYHVVSRCVRRQFLCGLDPLTGRDYSGRKQEIKDRLALLSEVFAVDVCAYAILSNHYHLVLHVDPERAMAWDELEVAHRWISLFRGPPIVRAFAEGQSLTDAQRNVLQKHLADYRARASRLHSEERRKRLPSTFPISCDRPDRPPDDRNCHATKGLTAQYHGR